MKKIIFAVLLLTGLCLEAKADGNPSILWDLGSVKINIPFTAVDAVALWDLRSKTGLGGGQTPIASLVPLKFNLVIGGVTSTEGVGTPYVGIEWGGVPNPTSQWFALESLHPGLFGGRNFHTNEYLYGIKASINIF